MALDLKPYVFWTSLSEGSVGKADGGSWTQKQLPRLLRGPFSELHKVPRQGNMLPVPGLIQLS
ncbi:hypothetical protein B0537_06770 [Desulforamulus ferrireducens]|uniref:Uncharacterized protein n=1 Tax=Desulforamulus ferrireducens TaxID=1833852 RepID=A0A1S6IVK2_9FIRM|nr:hypothetical protein B0537_06770 [Desulforamulus ferrireducens]